MNGSNNEIIEEWTPAFCDKLRSAEIRYGILHNRTDVPAKPRYKFKKVNGEIIKISIVLTKGFIMTNMGKGKFQERGNRKVKPAWNDVADTEVNELADKIAISTGDQIGKLIRFNP